MESKNLELITGKKVTKVWRGYGFFISFEFENISLNVEDSWAFVKDGKDLMTNDPNQNLQEGYKQVDQFISDNFKLNSVTLNKFEIQEDVTILYFSNGLEFEMNNQSNRDDDPDNWYLIDKSI